LAGEYPITFENNIYDLRVWLLDSDLPNWVYRCPIIQIDTKYENLIKYNYPKSIPAIHITQGYSGGSSTQFQRMGIQSINGPINSTNPTYSHFYHFAYTGDSGTPSFVLINDKIYLYKIVTVLGGGGVEIWSQSHINYINELIRRVDLENGVSTGYTVSAVNMSDLNVF